MGKTNVFWQTVAKHYTKSDEIDPNCKNLKYTCNYCAQRYASNVTRMSQHIALFCEKCPPEFKIEIRKILKSGVQVRVPKKIRRNFVPNLHLFQEASNNRNKIKHNTKWKLVSQHYNKLSSVSFPSSKFDKYSCKFCPQTFAMNITRMTQHIFDCEHCPDDIKTDLYSTNKFGRPFLPPLFETSEASYPSYDETSRHFGENFYHQICNNPEQATTSNIYVEQSEMVSENIVGEEDISEDLTEVETKFNITEIGFQQNYKDEENTDEPDEEIWDLFTKACCSTLTSFDILNNERWRLFFKKINSDLVLPNRELIYENLNKNYNLLTEDVDRKLTNVHIFSLQIHGLNKTRNEPEIKIILNTPSPVIYKILIKNSNNINNIVNNLDNMINQYGTDKFLSLISDSMTDNEIIYENLQKKHQNLCLTFYTCTRHVLNLLANDLIKIHTFTDQLKKFSTMLEEITNKKIIDELSVQFDLNNWKIIFEYLEFIIKNKQILETSSGIRLTTVTKSIINDLNFWTNINLIHGLLSCINFWFPKINCLSLAVECFADITKKFEEFLLKSELEDEANNILQCVKTRQNIAVNDIHKAANLLNPHFMGKNLTNDEIIDAISYINKLSKFLPEIAAEKIMYDLAAYRTKQGIWSRDFLWQCLLANEMQLPPIIWWQSMCTTTELSKIAVAILHCPVTLIKLKTSFAIKDQTWPNEELAKVIYIRHNTKLLNAEDCFYGMKTHHEENYDEDYSYYMGEI